jgi:hypothetical protein
MPNDIERVITPRDVRETALNLSLLKPVFPIEIKGEIISAVAKEIRAVLRVIVDQLLRVL